MKYRCSKCLKIEDIKETNQVKCSVCGRWNYDESYVLENGEPVKHSSLNHLQKYICEDCSEDKPTINKELQELREKLYNGHYPEVIKTKKLPNGMLVEVFPGEEEEENVKDVVTIGKVKNVVSKVQRRKI